MKRGEPDTSDRRAIDKRTQCVVRALKEATHGRVNGTDPIMEQLQKCPEAFQVGEILGKAFDSIKYARVGGEPGDRYLPPAGTVIPPLV